MDKYRGRSQRSSYYCGIYTKAFESGTFPDSTRVEGKAAVCNSFVKKQVENEHVKARGSVSFSEIEFDDERDNARLTMHYYCGGQCGYGREISLVRKGDKWTVTQSRGLYIL